MKFSACRVVGLAVLLSASSAGAQVVQYTGSDAGASAPGANSIAARNAFVAATGGSVMVDWERASVFPAGFTYATGPSSFLRTSSTCGGVLCGDNTTPAGTVFLELWGENATFSFAGGVNYFGAYFGGLQLNNNTINFSDGSSQSFSIPNPGGGFAFAGFSDFNQSITSVTIGVGGDIISVDDLIFGNTAVSVVPEPSTYAMMLMGIGAVAFAARRRRKV